MKKIILLFSLVLFIQLMIQAQTAATALSPKTEKALPEIKQNGLVKQLYVDGKPFIMLAGELHNSSASSIEYMKPVWNKLKALHVNTVVSTVSWELVEPAEGKFDFSLVDAQIREAQKRNIHIVLIWFGSWKNGDSTYPPLWVKTNPERFPVQQKKKRADGKPPMFDFFGEERTLPLSPLGETSMLAEAKAFRALMRHIREVDPEHAIIMMQADNEMGLMGDSRDRSPLAEAAWAAPVPAELMNYFIAHKNTLLPEMQEIWGRNGFRTSGTWSEVFGTDEWADEVFMAWSYSHYINKVISEGKKELNLPMYVNAWLGPQPGELLPGDWPSGGPVARVMDVWRAGAPSADLLAPDIYVQDFKGTCALYSRSGNPLWIPEAEDKAGNLFWALGHHTALGWSVFGVDVINVNGQVAKAYSILGEMLPPLAGWQAAGKVDGLLLLDGEDKQVVSLGGYKVTISKPQMFGPPSKDNQSKDYSESNTREGGISFDSRSLPDDIRPFCIVINSADDEFLIIGSNIIPGFTIDSNEPVKVAIGSIDEGSYSKGSWVQGRRLNGDEGRPSLRSLGMLKIHLYKYK
jgi:hypothetical protein